MSDGILLRYVETKYIANLSNQGIKAEDRYDHRILQP